MYIWWPSGDIGMRLEYCSGRVGFRIARWVVGEVVTNDGQVVGGHRLAEERIGRYQDLGMGGRGWGGEEVNRVRERKQVCYGE